MRRRPAPSMILPCITSRRQSTLVPNRLKKTGEFAQKKTAHHGVVMCRCLRSLRLLSLSEEGEQPRLVEDRDAELLCTGELGARFLPGDNVGGLF